MICKEMSIKEMFVLTNKSNIPVIKLYESIGESWKTLMM